MKLLTVSLVMTAFLLISAQAFAKDNFCAECHTSTEMAAFGNLVQWDRSIFQEKDMLCPGLLSLKREEYFTESRLVNYDKFLTELEEQTRRYSWYMKDDLVKQNVKYADLASSAPMSIAGFTTPNMKIKKSMHEIYEKLNKLRGDDQLEYVIGVSLFVTLLLSLLFAMGLKNTLKE